MTTTFLSDDEVARLTRYKQPKKQKEHLIKEGIPFTVDRSGRPIIFKDAVINKKQIEQIEPNWS